MKELSDFPFLSNLYLYCLFIPSMVLLVEILHLSFVCGSICSVSTMLKHVIIIFSVVQIQWLRLLFCFVLFDQL